jgi:hypothetical protein
MIDRPFHKGDPVHLQLLMQNFRALPEGWYDVTATKKARPATAARGYLHGVIVPLYADYIGECDKGEPWPDDEAWERLKKQFRPREYIDPVTQAVEVVGRSTKGMNPREVFELTEQVREWLEGQGVPVPLPDKRWREARARAMQQEQRSVA